MTLVGAKLKASVWFPPLRGMYQRGICKGRDTKLGDRNETSLLVTLNLFFAISLVVDRSVEPVVVDVVTNSFDNGSSLSPSECLSN